MCEVLRAPPCSSCAAGAGLCDPAGVAVRSVYLDALALHQAGICNTVALMGAAATEHQVVALKRPAPTVVLMLDGDDAGGQAIPIPLSAVREELLELAPERLGLNLSLLGSLVGAPVRGRGASS